MVNFTLSDYRRAIKGGDEMKKCFISFVFLFLIVFFSSAEASEITGVHVVEKNDTLFGIAFRYNLSIKELMEMNQIKERDVIIGQVLNISQTTQLKGKKIVLDPGHGGIETGAEHNGLIEKDETLEVSLKTKRLLEAEGAQVILTLDENFQDFKTLPLAERAKKANQAGADLFISIHFNANSYTSVHGTETYYNKNEYKGTSNPYPNESKELAKSIQQSIVNEAHTKDLGVKENVFHVLRNNAVPSALVEVGFVTNKDEVKRIQTNEFKEKIALGISKGVVDYIHNR